MLDGLPEAWHLDGSPRCGTTIETSPGVHPNRLFAAYLQRDPDGNRRTARALAAK